MFLGQHVFHKNGHKRFLLRLWGESEVFVLYLRDLLKYLLRKQSISSKIIWNANKESRVNAIIFIVWGRGNGLINEITAESMSSYNPLWRSLGYHSLIIDAKYTLLVPVIQADFVKCSGLVMFGWKVVIAFVSNVNTCQVFSTSPLLYSSSYT